MNTQTYPVRQFEPSAGIGKILVASDFSPASQKAFEYALRLGQQFGAELQLLHVVEPIMAATFAGVVPSPPPFSDDEFFIAEKYLDQLAKSARSREVEAKPLVRVGVATHEIVEAAREEDVDLIVIATHGHTGWRHFAIGSTAERVVRAAPCPVLVVREKEHEFS